MKQVIKSQDSRTEIAASWEKLGKILSPDENIYWMSICTGSSYAMQMEDSSLFDIFVTGRDKQNRSLIGRIRIDINNPTKLIETTVNPVLSFGGIGSFDENGVSYPYLVKSNNKVFMYYTGWMPTVLTPFQNQIGLAEQSPDGSFKRVSRAPILERNNDDYLSCGSCCVLVENNLWKMWYTSFTSWERIQAAIKHYYLIKYAESFDGINWNRRNQVCIDFQNPHEYAIARPSVLNINNSYHMWYTYRGEKYKIGYAYSADGVHWRRRDDLVRIEMLKEDWDSESQCYPHVFKHEKYLYMLYCGNNYGKEGLGLARMRL